jgi:hypothetical protein
MTPILTDDEVAQICDPLKMGGAQFRYLKRLGLVVNRKPNGRPLVARGEIDRVLTGRQTETANSAQPNVVALMSLVNQRRGLKNGTQAQ